MTDRLIALFADVLQVGAGALGEDTSPQTAPEWDSMANMMLIAAIEETYEVELTTPEFEKMKTIGAVRQVLADRGITA